MLTLNISPTDIELAKYERIENPIETIRKRMDAIFLDKPRRWSSRNQIQEILMLLFWSKRQWLEFIP